MFEFYDMNKAVISLKEALQLMAKKDKNNVLVPFNMTYRTFNETSKKGGKLKEYVGATYLPEANPNREIVDNIHNILDPVKSIKNPNHFENRTRNIKLSDGSVVSIRFDFIISINQQNVIY
jgi:hypothetical protein